jgi:hypothetical protein
MVPMDVPVGYPERTDTGAPAGALVVGGDGEDGA